METGGSPVVAVKKTNFTPKAIIYQKFGSKACYKVEEVQEPTQNGCPGLAIPRKGPSLYRCRLELPEFVVVSETFKKKKEAEQSAADKALKQLGIHPPADNPTEQELWHSLSDRITYLFSDEFLSCIHPLSGHLRAALWRDGDLCGSVPVSVFAACDAKLNSICKSLDPKVELNPFLALSLVMRAAARLPESVVTSKGQFLLQKQNRYPTDIMESSDNKPSCSLDSLWVQAIHIPSSLDKPIEAVTLDVSSAEYYLDVIAQKLGVLDASRILLSRTIGKASSETRLYFTAPESCILNLPSDLANEKYSLEESLNARATYICGQNVHGNAIMASIGYTWRSKDLVHEDISLQSYYRMLIGKIPSGSYKLSREAILAAELPTVFTTKTNWRGSFPREILCSFCRQHQLSEPVFSAISVPLKQSCKFSRSTKKLKVVGATEQESEYPNGRDMVVGDGESLEPGSTFRCDIKIFSKFQELIIECSPKESYKKQSDATHNTCLKVLSWLNAFFVDPDMPEKLNHCANVLNIQFYNETFLKEFVLCPSVNRKKGGNYHESANLKMMEPLNIKGSDSCVYASSGSLSCVSYTIALVTENGKELLETNDEFEFEMGTGSVISPLETVVTQMSVGQSAFFNLDLPRQEFILAAAEDYRRILPLLSMNDCHLRCCVSFLWITEPPEERMEQALFNPPLSKQRVEYALQQIRKSSATSLVDFGCGSGSLLDSLLNYPTSLETIVGVDISQKSLSRAAKVLHSKLSTKLDVGIKRAVLYDGSITDFDCQLCKFDIGTCLEILHIVGASNGDIPNVVLYRASNEDAAKWCILSFIKVIEHMEEDQACLFGDVALGYFRPKILVVSTPNYEYNVILQKSSLSSQEEDPDEKSQSQSSKFRNHDHKFEWTREQFNQWASELAKKHNYSVEFSGVGGSANVEPGFASQIAVFIREIPPEEDDLPENGNERQHCKVIWEWNNSDRSEFSV